MTEHVKIVVFSPLAHADAVRKAIGEAGAGKIGAYSFCSFSAEGVGRYIGDGTSHPAIGEAGKLETVKEVRIEAICERRRLEGVLTAIEEVHPYEEIAVDIYPVEFRRLTRKHH